ncbi:thiamine pyrophosphate-binding protein [Mycolicibacterium agri]|uniref:thiamine pyrophosphate-binding protein n=1 Tax=Mycolicibacterium agri TaxID=36811 RepID=UPI0010562D59|nr:thiamine pyrophosphate-binding protein [Mycolicibacterium agri]
MTAVADHAISLLQMSGVRRVYGLPGDSLNGFTDAIRRSGEITWEHIRHEETAAFAAAADAALTGQLAVCAGSCGPGNLHLINGLFDAHRSRVPVLAIAAHIPRGEIGSEYFQQTHLQELFRECSVYCELVSIPEMAPRILAMAMRTAVEENGVAVVVIPGEIFLQRISEQPVRPIAATKSVLRPDDESVRRAADLLNAAERVTILGGAGVAGSHAALIQLAETLQAPVVHALRGKEFIEYDNPYDVGMTGLLGFASGYKAIKEADTLLMLGTDFPYQQFYPDNATVIQVDIRGRNLGRRTPIELGLRGTVKDTLAALQPLLHPKHDREHDHKLLQEMLIRARAATDSSSPATRRDAAAILALAAWNRSDLHDAMRWLAGDTPLLMAPVLSYFHDHLILSARVASAAGDAGLRARVLAAIDTLGREHPPLPLVAAVCRYAQAIFDRDPDTVMAEGLHLKEHGRPLLYACAAQDAAREFKHVGRTHEAVEVLKAAFDTLADCGAVADARLVGRQLRQLGVIRRLPARRHGRTGWDSLTDTEIKVAHLYTQDGATTRSVAGKLHLSPHTVKTHVRNIFAKLHIRSRVELVRVVQGRNG